MCQNIIYVKILKYNLHISSFPYIIKPPTYNIFLIFVFLSLGVIYHLILNSIIVEKTITIKKIIAIKFEIRIPIRNANGNEPQIRSKDEENIINIGETEIVIHNNGNKLKLKDNNLKKNQKKDEPNRNSERKNVLTNSRLNNPN